MGRHRVSSPIKLIWIAIGIVVTTIAIVVAFREPTKADVLIDYLDSNGVSYSSRESMLHLADTLCELRAKDAYSFSFLTSVFSNEDAFAIEAGVFNGEYCE